MRRRRRIVVAHVVPVVTDAVVVADTMVPDAVVMADAVVADVGVDADPAARCGQRRRRRGPWRSGQGRRRRGVRWLGLSAGWRRHADGQQQEQGWKKVT